jgi:hypothetical protein
MINVMICNLMNKTFFKDFLGDVSDVTEHRLPVQRAQQVLPHEREGHGQRHAHPGHNIIKLFCFLRH